MDVQEITTVAPQASESSELPFPFQQHPFCRYESIEKTIDRERVLVVDNLLRDENDLSEIAIAELGKNVKAQLKIERHIASLALQNIVTNIARLVKEPSSAMRPRVSSGRSVSTIKASVFFALEKLRKLVKDPNYKKARG